MERTSYCSRCNSMVKSRLFAQHVIACLKYPSIKLKDLQCPTCLQIFNEEKIYFYHHCPKKTRLSYDEYINNNRPRGINGLLANQLNDTIMLTRAANNNRLTITNEQTVNIPNIIKNKRVKKMGNNHQLLLKQGKLFLLKLTKDTRKLTYASRLKNRRLGVIKHMLNGKYLFRKYNRRVKRTPIDNIPNCLSFKVLFQYDEPPSDEYNFFWNMYDYVMSTAGPKRLSNMFFPSRGPKLIFLNK
jgi:hypothetical protein